MAGSWSLFLLLVLAVVLLVSGGAKLRDRASFADALDGFGVLPAGVRAVVAPVLPVAEVVLGLALLLVPGLALGVALALATVLLLAFTALVAVTLARGERPSCQCFGSVSAEPISGWTLLRNAALVLLAVVLLVGAAPSRGLVLGLGDASTDALSGLGFLVLLAVSVVVLWVRQDRVAAGAPVGSQAQAAAAQPPSLATTQIPPLHLVSPDGVPTQLRELAAQKAQLLVYVSPTCTTCHQLVPLAAEWQELLGAELDVRLVSIGNREETTTAYPHHAGLMWVDEEQGFGQLGIPGTPSALLLGTNETVAAGPAAGVPAIQELLGTVVQALGVNLMTGAAQQSPQPTTATREEQAGWVPEVGAALPQLTVVAEDGTVSSYPDALAEVAARAGTDTVTTLAWASDCSWCAGILDDVRRASAGGDVVLVVGEDPAAVRAQGLTGPVLRVLEPGTAAEAVGVPGTPGAVPVREGRVAGLGGLGGPHVLEVLAEHAHPART